MNRRTILLGGGTVAAGGLAGCLADGDDDRTESKRDDPGSGGPEEESDDEGPAGERPLDRSITLGVLLPFSGKLGTFGAPLRDAARLPARQFEAADIDLEVDVHVADTESDPGVGRDAALSLVENDCPAIVGPFSSPVTATVAESVLYPHTIVGITPSSMTPDSADAFGDYLLRTAPTTDWQGERLAELAADSATSAGVVHLDNAYGRSIADAFTASFEGLGGTVTNQVAIEAGRSSYDAALESALEADPDLLLVVSHSYTGVQLFRDYYAGFDADRPILTAEGLDYDPLPSTVNHSLANVTGISPSGAGPEWDAFESQYRSEFDREPGVYTDHAYDAAAVLILANVAAGANDGSAIRDAVPEVSNPDGEVFGPANLPEAVELVAEGQPIQYRGASGRVEFTAGGPSTVTYRRFTFNRDGVRSIGSYEYES